MDLLAKSDIYIYTNKIRRILNVFCGMKHIITTLIQILSHRSRSISVLKCYIMLIRVVTTRTFGRRFSSY